MEGLIYRLDQRPRGGALWLSTLQWFMFTLANIITVPIVVGHAFHLSAAGIAMFTERTFFVCGVIGFLQAWLGHRFPVIEGPAGMWWGVFLVLVQMAVDKGQSLGVLLQELELGLMVGGLVFIVLGVSGQLGRVRRLFTPAVTGTFLILVALQVAHSLVEGVLGIGFRGRETVAPEVAGLSVLVLAVAMGLMFKARGMVQSISVLIGLGCGWVLFSVFGLVDAPVADTPWVALPSLLPFGPPKWNLGVCLTGAITGGILLSNLIASLQALAAAAGEQVTDQRLSRGALMTGVGTLLTGLFGVVGMVPLSSCAGLVSLTRMASRLPFMVASIAVALLGFFPTVGQWAATLPSPVGYAILFVVFAQMIGFGLRDYRSMSLDQRDVLVIGISLTAAVGVFAVPATAWNGLPPVLGYVLDNGLIVGILLVLLFEHVLLRRPQATVSPESSLGINQAPNVD